MDQALRLAVKAAGRTSPNPLVGALVVKDGKVVGRGYHLQAGTPHAEVLALQEAGEAARGAILYVTLEPCAHHGRTPPCVDAVEAAGVARVVAAMTDPNPLVSGRGLARLRQAGIDVEVGVREGEARRLNEAFEKHIRTGLPFLVLKAAVSLDGKTATRSGDSRWVTSEEARRHVHGLRNSLDAIMVGVGTVLADDPQLTCRLPDGRDPVRVVVDSLARTPPEARVVSLARSSPAPTLIAVTPAVPAQRRRALEAAGAKVLVIDGPGPRVDLRRLAAELGRRNITSLLLEGGSTLAEAAQTSGLVDKYMFYLAPKLVGGKEAPGPLGGQGVHRMSDAYPLRITAVERLGGDLLVEAYPAASAPFLREAQLS
ncbi:MAG: bifunctional diaminohydroxyphosphoribosylaminopyrimidine deaminase/5-amino-6-(5-phosphoribosylamino)uracil reductase RibD [Firmicutes bacterium]|nr:bifunctional diaminohydroxyphosphoribosylaminopyrimidine deaminase/5-amino-6-(5-phosphoribosylamino)uracil reductase RibD [Bacillota bacterium]